MTPLILLFGEVLPKTIAVSHSEKFSFFVARPIDLFARIIFPLRWALRPIVDGLIGLLGKRKERNENIFYEKELKDLVDAGHKEGVLEEEERELIHNILKFNDTLVYSIMTPRATMFTLPHDTTIEKAIKQVTKHRYSRIPVYEHNQNTIIGVLNAKDLLTLDYRKDGGTTLIAEIVRPVNYIPQDRRIQLVLKEFQEKKIHLALAVNKSKRVVGLVTIEDVLEELFGEIYDEFDAVIKRKK